MSYKPLVGISTTLQLRCSLSQIRAG